MRSNTPRDARRWRLLAVTGVICLVLAASHFVPAAADVDQSPSNVFGTTESGIGTPDTAPAATSDASSANTQENQSTDASQPSGESQYTDGAYSAGGTSPQGTAADSPSYAYAAGSAADGAGPAAYSAEPAAYTAGPTAPPDSTVTDPATAPAEAASGDSAGAPTEATAGADGTSPAETAEAASIPATAPAAAAGLDLSAGTPTDTSGDLNGTATASGGQATATAGEPDGTAPVAAAVVPAGLGTPPATGTDEGTAPAPNATAPVDATAAADASAPGTPASGQHAVVSALAAMPRGGTPAVGTPGAVMPVMTPSVVGSPQTSGAPMRVANTAALASAVLTAGTPLASGAGTPVAAGTPIGPGMAGAVSMAAPKQGSGGTGGDLSSLDPIWGGQTEPLTQDFGPTDFSQNNCAEYSYGTSYGLPPCSHPGLDIGMPSGTALYSPVSGTVVLAGGTGYYCYNGDCTDPGVGELLIQTDDGNQVILGHMSMIAVQPGQRVEVGQFVGYSGGENGDHVHLETRELQPDGSYKIVDPRDSFLQGDLAVGTPSVPDAPTPTATPSPTSTVAAPTPTLAAPTATPTQASTAVTDESLPSAPVTVAAVPTLQPTPTQEVQPAGTPPSAVEGALANLGSEPAASAGDGSDQAGAAPIPNTTSDTASAPTDNAGDAASQVAAPLAATAKLPVTDGPPPPSWLPDPAASDLPAPTTANAAPSLPVRHVTGFVGKVTGTDDYVAIAVEDVDGVRTLQAYVSDGQTTADWFTGPLPQDRFELAATSGIVGADSTPSATPVVHDPARLAGTVTEQKVSGTLTLAGAPRPLPFEATRTDGRTGLYTLSVAPDGTIGGPSATGTWLAGKVDGTQLDLSFTLPDGAHVPFQDAKGGPPAPGVWRVIVVEVDKKLMVIGAKQLKTDTPQDGFTLAWRVA